MAEYIVRSASPVRLLVQVFESSSGCVLAPGESVPIHGKKQYALILNGRDKQAMLLPDIIPALNDIPVCGYVTRGQPQPSPLSDGSVVVFVWELSNGYWNKFRRFSIFPHPNRPYREILKGFYNSRPPRIDILPVRLTEPNPSDPSILDEDWDSVSLKDRTFRFTVNPGDAGGYHGTEGLFVLDHIRLEYSTNLQLLWELPLLGLVSKYHNPLIETSGFLVRFRSDDRTDHVLLSFKDISHWSRWAVKTSYTISDTLVIIYSLLGYRSIPMNELVFLMLTWWADALTKFSYNMTLSSCRYSSVLLVSDMMNRVESPGIFMGMLNSFSRYPYIRTWSGGLVSSGIYLGSESIFPRYVYVSVNLKQADFIQVWNLLRTQMGLPVVTAENYLEVTDVSSSPV